MKVAEWEGTVESFLEGVESEQNPLIRVEGPSTIYENLAGTMMEPRKGIAAAANSKPCSQKGSQHALATPIATAIWKASRIVRSVH